MADIKCENCGKPYDDEFEVCPHCGSTKHIKPKKKKSLRIIIPVLAAVVFIAGGACVYYFLFYAPEKDGNKTVIYSEEYADRDNEDPADTSDAIADGAKDKGSQQAINPESVVKSVDIDEVPQEVKEFLRWFTWYWHGDYNCHQAGNDENNILAAALNSPYGVDHSVYPGNEETREYWGKGETDPRGWFGYDGNNMYTKYSAEHVEFIAKNIFHASDSDIKVLLKKGEDNKQFYKENVNGTDYYYASTGGYGGGPYIFITNAEFDGEKYYLNYDAFDMVNYRGSFYAITDIEKIDGKDYCTLFERTRLEDVYPKIMYSKVNELLVRTGSGTNHPAIRKLNTGDSVTVKAITSDGKWAFIGVENGRFLYVSLEYLSETEP